MDQSTPYVRVLEGVLQALENEKTELEKKLETELEISEKEIIEERLAEIDNDLKIHRIGLPEPSSDAEQAVRRSEREKHPTEKMLEFIKQESIKKERKFMLTYVNFKAVEVQYIRTKLKEARSKSDLGEMIRTLEKFESELKQEYESLHALTTPAQYIRRKMDCCTSVASEIITLLKVRYAEVDKEFDAEAVKETLSKLLQREDAR